MVSPNTVYKYINALLEKKLDIQLYMYIEKEHEQQELLLTK